MKLLPFGPATIKHDSTEIGRTHGGGTLNFLTQQTKPIANFHKVEEFVYGVEGEINLFQHDGEKEISSDMTLYDYGVIEFLLGEGKITLYNAKIFLPDSLSIGTNSQEPFTVRISGGEDSDGKIFKLN